MFSEPRPLQLGDITHRRKIADPAIVDPVPDLLGAQFRLARVEARRLELGPDLLPGEADQLDLAVGARARGARNEQEGLAADVQHHARSGARHAAEARVELAPTAMIRSEGEAGAGLDLVLGRDPDRSRQRLANTAAVDRRPRAAGMNRRRARG